MKTISLKSGTNRLAGSPLGAITLGLLLFFSAFYLLRQDVPLIVAAFIIACLGMFMLVKPEWGLHLVVFHSVVVITSYFGLPRFGPITIPIILMGVLVLAFAIQLSVLGKTLYLNLPENWLLLLHTLLMILSMLFADHVGRDNLGTFRSYYVLLVVVFLLLLNLIDTREAFVRLLWVLVLASATLVISGILNKVGLLESTIEAERLQGRTVGFIGNPNALAFTLIGLLPLVLAFAFHVRRRVARGALLLLAAGSVFVILNTLSRGGFIALIAVAMWMTLRWSRDRRLLALIVVLGIIGNLLLPAELFDRFDEVKSVTGHDRFAMAQVAINMAVDNPILGVGYGNFRRYFPKYDEMHRGGAPDAHNLYLWFAAQTGFPDLIVYLSILLLVWRRLNRLARRSRGDRDRFVFLIATALEGSMVNIFVFGLSMSCGHTYPVFVVLASALILDRISSGARTAAPDAEETSSIVRAQTA